MKPIIVFLFDKSGVAAEPWAKAGFDCYCVDIEHSIRRDRRVSFGQGSITFVWGDARSWRPPEGRPVGFVGAFPPCTHVAVSGARDFEKKAGFMLRDALETFESARQACGWSCAPYFIENPVGVLSSIPHIGKPGFYFDPSEYAGWIEKPEDEAYTKKTGIWSGGGFIIPEKKPVTPHLMSKMHKLAPSDDRAELRSKTPMGFSIAVFEANYRQVLRRWGLE